MLFTDVVITARVERRLVHGYERYFSMRKTCHESYLGFNRGSGITGYHEQSKSGERKKLEATDSFYFSGKTGFWKATVQENARFFDKGDMAAFACHLCEDALTKEEVQVLKKKLDELN